MKLIDTHCHLCHARLRGQLDAVLARAREVGVIAFVCAAGDLQESEAAQGLAHLDSSVYCMAGIHPHDAKDASGDYLDRLRRLAGDRRNVAVGEIGLDYHYNYSPREDQRRVFAEQLQMARQLGKKVVIHTREAFDETLSILTESKLPGRDVVFHSCTEGRLNVQRALDTGAMVSFSGVVTFAKADALREAAGTVPADRLLIETDCPFLSPVPVRDVHTNEPANVVHIAACLARVGGLSVEDLAERTTANAIGFFGLDG